MFCGNVLTVKSRNGDYLLIMSDKAFNAFNQNQKDVLSKYAKLIKVNVDYIEKHWRWRHKMHDGRDLFIEYLIFLKNRQPHLLTGVMKVLTC